MIMGMFDEFLLFLGARKVVKSIEEDALRQQQLQQQEYESMMKECDDIEENLRQIKEDIKIHEQNLDNFEAELKKNKERSGHDLIMFGKIIQINYGNRKSV